MLLFQFASAQKDPLDPGQADTLYFSAGGQHSADGDTLYLPPGSSSGDVVILINFWNDYGIRGFTIPLSDTCSPKLSKILLDPVKNNGSISPTCFHGSRVEDFDFNYINLSLYPDSNKVLYGASSFEDSADPGNGIFASMIYSVTDTTTICLDTTSFPPENFVKFVTPLSAGYRPIFVPRSFQVGVRSNESPTVDAPDLDSVALKDSIEIIFTAEDPDNDSLMETPEIEIIPFCGEFHVERTDTGAFTGSWELTWSTETGGCVVDTYYIVMRVEDKYGATGEDTTEMIIWKPNHPPQIIISDTVYGYTDTVAGYMDTVVFTFSAVDPDSDVIEPFYFGKPSCLDTLSVIQTYGSGTHEGVWEVTLQIKICDIGDYPFLISIKDERSVNPGDPDDPGWDTVTTMIHLDIKPGSPPVLDAPDETLWVWIDYELNFEFYAADPDSHKLLDNASISVEPYCGDTCEYWVNRLWGQGDPGNPSGEWQVQFNAYKSDSDYYHIILDITDDHDSTGYDTVVVHVFPRPNYNPEVFTPPTASTQINDTLQFLFTASDPDSNDLLNSASLTLQPDCGTYLAVRQTSTHAFFGTWKFFFYTFGCTAGVYDIIIDVKDVRDGVGYDTTSILVTDRPDSAPIVVAPHLITGESGEIINYEFSAVDPDTDIIMDIANIIVNPNCGVYFANRTSGNGTYTGIWELTFKTTGCGPGDYDVYMQVQDVYYKMGYAVTTVRLSPTGIEEEGLDISIDRFALNQNYPNPFNLSTEIAFQVPVESKVNLKIYNTRGRLVRSLVDGILNKGLYNIRWDGKDEAGNEVASGIYFYKLAAGEFTSVKKMVLLK
jgi:hypothetical protein